MLKRGLILQEAEVRSDLYSAKKEHQQKKQSKQGPFARVFASVVQGMKCLAAL